MTITEILEIIYKERVQLEIYEALHDWVMKDRSEWIDRAVDDEATIRAINKIATGNKNAKDALEGIINISSCVGGD